MAITVNDKDLGMVTAYAYAVAGGYTGTEAEFEALLGNIAGDLAKIENLTVEVETLPAGSEATASYADGALTLGIPQGDQGIQGPAGPQGPKGDPGEVTQAVFDELAGDVDELKSAVRDIYDGYTLRELLFEKGGITDFKNTSYRSNCRCRTQNILIYPFDLTISIVKNATIVAVLYYDSQGTGTEEIVLQDNTTKSVTIPRDTNFRFFVDGIRGSSPSEMTIREILSHISVTAGYDSINSLTGKVAGLANEVDDIANEVDDIANANKYGIPSYYYDNDYLPSKAVSAQMASNVNGISFGFVTDMHTGDSSRNAMKVAKYIADNTSAIPFMICGGDIPETNVGTEAGLHEQAMMWQDMMSQFGKHKVYTCRGNHDYLAKLSDNSGYWASHGACHSYVMGYMPDNVVASGNMKMSYYVDFDTVKTRFIVLDEYDISDTVDFTGYVGLSPAQFHWLAEDALNASGYNIIIVAHQAINPTDYAPSGSLTFLKNVITAFNNHTAFSGSYGATTLNVDFSTYTSNLICVLSGHSHKDYSYSNGFLTIGATCDAVYDTDGYNRALGRIDEIAFDVISIDFDNHSIRCTRIGAGNDRTFTY